MKISGLVVWVAMGVLVAAGVPVLAQSPSFSNFSSTTGLTLNGSATATANLIRLTPTQQSEAGSVWFNTKQPLTNGFTTTFSFRIWNDQGEGGFPFPADGLVFVIQNDTDEGEGVNALGGGGGAIGYSDNAPTIPGISHSLAVEFDTFDNAGPGPNNDPDNNHVAIQSCGAGANSADHGGPCFVAIAPSASLGGVTLWDGNPHTASISYASGRLHVSLDNIDLFPPGEGNPSGGVAFDITTLGLDSGTAYVGFTAATGAFVENADLLSWTFTPQAQSAPVTAGGGTATLSFQGGTANNAYDYTAALDAGGVTSATVKIKPVLMSKSACQKLVQKSFPLTQCFVYQNAAGMGVDAAVLFELTCPDQPGGTCGSAAQQNFFADLGTDFTFLKSENPGFNFIANTIGPYPGWLKGSGPNALAPCTPFTNNTPALFQSNQITAFSVVGDPTGKTIGKSGGGGSCWVATYLTAGELPPGIKVTNPKLTTYTRNQSVTASYSCSNPPTTKPASNPTGPYLTVASCKQSQAPNLNNGSSCTTAANGTISCTGGVDTSTKGLHIFEVTAVDSGGNVNINLVLYNVK